MSTPEEAANYLRRTNFKALIEWLTAECILHRPEDPLAFCKNIMDAKLEDRGAAGYNSEAPMEFLKATYAKASSSADEHGRIYGNGDGKELAEQTRGTTAPVVSRLEALENIIEACRTIAMQLDPAMAQEKIVMETCRILKADRATLFRVDAATDELVLQVAEGIQGIRVPLGRGIAGTVGQSGAMINIPDAYADDRFDQSHDAESGYKTNSILCGPIKDTAGGIIGVLQVINKTEGTFHSSDEGVLEILASQAGIALKNADLFTQTERSRARFESLLDIIKALQSDMGLSSLLFTMTMQAPRVVNADRATVFLIDDRDEDLWAMQGDVNMRFPKGQGIAGSVATTGETINIPEAYEDERFNQSVDQTTGYRTKTILCMPILAAGKIVGVCQVINKKVEGPFDSEDEEVMGAFLSIAGPIIQSSQLFQNMRGSAEEGNELTGNLDHMSAKARRQNSSQLPQMAELAEEG